MLREVTSIRQDNPALMRRWFQSDYFDLFTWQDASGAYIRFQLCYDVERRERAFAWSREHGFFHDGVDYAQRPGDQSAAIFVPDGKFDSGTVAPRFTAEAQRIPAELRDLVLGKIREHLLEQWRRREGRRRVRREGWQARQPAPGDRETG